MLLRVIEVLHGEGGPALIDAAVPPGLASPDTVHPSCPGPAPYTYALAPDAFMATWLAQLPAVQQQGRRDTAAVPRVQHFPRRRSGSQQLPVRAHSREASESGRSKALSCRTAASSHRSTYGSPRTHVGSSHVVSGHAREHGRPR